MGYRTQRRPGNAFWAAQFVGTHSVGDVWPDALENGVHILFRPQSLREATLRDASVRLVTGGILAAAALELDARNRNKSINAQRCEWFLLVLFPECPGKMAPVCIEFGFLCRHVLGATGGRFGPYFLASAIHGAIPECDRELQLVFANYGLAGAALHILPHGQK